MGAFDTVKNIVIPDPDKPEEAALFRQKWGWDAHEQVIIKGRFTAGIQKAVANTSAKMDKAGEMEILFGSGHYTMLEEMIVSWTLTGDGRPLPVSPGNIEALPANYSTPILEVCDKLAAGMSAEAQKSFLPFANGASPVILGAEK